MSSTIHATPTEQEQKQPYDADEFLQTPTDSEMSLGLESRRPSYTLERERQHVDGAARLKFVLSTGDHVSAGTSKLDQFSQVVLSFREAASSQIAGGANVGEVLSMSGLELDLFFRERVDGDPHTISTWACEFAKSWTSLSPVSQIAVVYLAGSFMRWFILPCRETYAAMSPLLHPVKGDLIIHSMSEIDYCKSHAADRINGLTMNARQLQWPYTYLACLEEPTSISSSATRRLSRMFMEFCDDPRNWIG